MGNCLSENIQDINEYDYTGFTYEHNILKTNFKNSIMFSKNPFYIYLAYNNTTSPSNILGNNILILDSHYYVKLISFFYTDTTICYRYENNIELSIMRCQDSTVIYNFKHGTLNMTLNLDLFFNIREKQFVCTNNKHISEYDILLQFIRNEYPYKGGIIPKAQMISNEIIHITEDEPIIAEHERMM